jgi:hypothetical protein
MGFIPTTDAKHFTRWRDRTPFMVEKPGLMRHYVTVHLIAARWPSRCVGLRPKTDVCLCASILSGRPNSELTQEREVTPYV